MAVLPTGDSATQWAVYIRANAVGGEVMKALVAALRVSTGLVAHVDAATLWRKFHGR